jgi:hypothetical protein
MPAMEQHRHLDIPPSFQALYETQRTARLKPVWAEVCARYELCEDMAQMLVDTAQTLQFQLGVTETDVLVRVWQGLAQPDSVVNPGEARWVVHRLAELCGWPQPDAAAPAPTGVTPA